LQESTKVAGPQKARGGRNGSRTRWGKKRGDLGGTARQGGNTREGPQERDKVVATGGGGGVRGSRSPTGGGDTK